MGMTRGRNRNVAHLVADTLDEARSHWIEVFNRGRADLGPGHAADVAEEAIERYGPKAPEHSTALQAAALRRSEHRASEFPLTATPRPHGIGI